VLSKRKLIQLVEEKHVSGWDDPRMPTLVGARRRGYTPEGFRAFAERIGVAKGDSWIDYTTLEDCMREHLNEIAPRRIAVLDPLKLVIDNYPDGQTEECQAPNHPQQPELGKRAMPFSKELWIEREDFSQTPPKGYFRLFPGNKVRLRYGFVVECTAYDAVTDTVHCTYDADTKSGTPGSDKVKVKGNIHWVSAQHSYAAEVRLFDRLFGAGGSEGERFRARSAARQSVLDFVADDAKRLQRQVSGSDRRKVDEYFESVRAVEKQIDQMASLPPIEVPGTSRPEADPADTVKRIRLMYDLMALAYQTDATRVITFMTANAQTNRVYDHLGITSGHHQLTHSNGQEAEIQKIDRFMTEEFARFVGKLQSIPEGEGSYSINEANEAKWYDKTKAMVRAFRLQETQCGKRAARYAGALVGDFHRTLLKGGIYMYPGEAKKPESGNSNSSTNSADA
jgi:hypothetical protein